MLSEKNKLILNDFISIAKNTAIFFGPQVLTYLTEQVNNHDFGNYGFIIAGALSVGIKALDKYKTETVYKNG